MSRLLWSPAALQDIQRLYRFLADINLDAAKRAIKAIREAVQILSAHPEAGRPAEEMEAEYRELLISFGSSGYVALYRHDGETTMMLAIRHQKEAGYGYF